MKNIFPAIAMLFTIAANAQFKNDDVLYKTVDPLQLCNALQDSPGYILLDVRSVAENADTTPYGLNYGRFNGAINIPVMELGRRIHELDTCKNKPVFVYCSHSQRSRRASKMLADSGFTNINNINGGITAFHYLSAIQNNTCLKGLYQTSNKFGLISPGDLCKKISTGKNNVFLLDVRNDSAFRHTSNNEKEKAMGTLAGSVNIPLAQLKNKISLVPRNKEIVLIDIYGDDAEKAASLLADKGFKKILVLIEGIDRWVAMDNRLVPCNNQLYKASVSYRLLPVFTFADWIKEKKKYTIVDIRSDSEYLNMHKDAYRNIGHIKGSVHIPPGSLEKRMAELEKNKDIIIYGFGGGPDAFTAASKLAANGFTKVNVLLDGIFNIRWTAGNISGYKWLQELVEDVPEENR